MEIQADSQINPRTNYTLGEIVRGGFIPGIDTVQKATRLVQRDKFTDKILDAEMVPRGANGVQYKVKGSNIIKYLDKRHG